MRKYWPGFSFDLARAFRLCFVTRASQSLVPIPDYKYKKYTSHPLQYCRPQSHKISTKIEERRRNKEIIMASGIGIGEHVWVTQGKTDHMAMYIGDIRKPDSDDSDDNDSDNDNVSEEKDEEEYVSIKWTTTNTIDYVPYSSVRLVMNGQRRRRIVPNHYMAVPAPPARAPLLLLPLPPPPPTTTTKIKMPPTKKRKSRLLRELEDHLGLPDPLSSSGSNDDDDNDSDSVSDSDIQPLHNDDYDDGSDDDSEMPPTASEEVEVERKKQESLRKRRKQAENRRNKRTPEQIIEDAIKKSIYAKETRMNRTPEQIEEENRRKSIYHKKARLNRTPKQITEENSKKSLYHKKARVNRTPEKIEKDVEYDHKKGIKRKTDRDRKRSMQATINDDITVPDWKAIHVGSRVGVFWEDDNCYYSGTVVLQNNDDDTGLPTSIFLVCYDDNTVDTEDMENQKFCFVEGDDTEKKVHQIMQSVFIPKDNDGSDKKHLHILMKQFTKYIVNNLGTYIMPIVPLNNGARSNHQSAQAIRIFFSLFTEAVNGNNNLERRSIYGPTAVLNTTGMSPDDFRVYSMTPLLKEITDLFTKIIKLKLGPQYTNLDFNFMEAKVLLGKDMFCDINGNILLNNNKQPLKSNSNKTIGPHNDINYDDNGKQDEKDTADGSHPIGTYNFGATRKLTFQWMMKNINKNKPIWEKVRMKNKDTVGKKKLVDDCRVFDMSDGSIMILDTLDESPLQINENSLYKTKHRSKFFENGVSIGFVFRRVRSTSLFHKDSHHWAWQDDKDYRECGMRSTTGVRSIKHKNYRTENKGGVEDVGLLALIKNVQDYVENYN